MADYRSAGASGFGLGSALFHPGLTASEVQTRANSFVVAIETTMSSAPVI
jgi:2-dehydro-3-deoxyphosphogalactonate aldolase